MNENPKENICRICLKLTDDTFTLFQVYENNKSLADIFNQFLEEKLIMDDGITSSICEECAESIVVFNNLIFSYGNSVKFFKNSNFINSTGEFNEGQESPVDRNVIKTEEGLGDEEVIFQFSADDIPQSEVIIEDNGEISYFDDTDSKKEVKPYMCEVCGSFWRRLSDFKDHYETHLAVCNYTCSECGKKLKTRSTYSRHMQRHKGSACICEQCGQTFACKNTLKTHIYLKHIGERKWVCHVCDKKFPLKSTLQKHLYRQHIREDAPERKHKCLTCEVEYLDKCSLNRHMELKHGNKEKVYCFICGKSYLTNSHLNRHMRVKHHAGNGEIKNEMSYSPQRIKEEEDLDYLSSCDSESSDDESSE